MAYMHIHFVEIATNMSEAVRCVWDAPLCCAKLVELPCVLMLLVHIIALVINTFVDELMLFHWLTDVKGCRCCTLLSTSSVEIVHYDKEK